MRPAAPRRAGPFFDVDVLGAGHGDSLWIEYGDETATHRVLIDCGTQATAEELLERVAALPQAERAFELLMMSHIDADHIGGALPFLQNAVKQGARFGDVWFNGWRHLSGRLGAQQGEIFSTMIQEMRLPWNAWRDGGVIVTKPDEDLPVHTLPGGMVLTLLSPTPVQLAKLAPAWSRELKKHGLEPGARVDYSRFLRGKPSTSTNVDELAATPFTSDAAEANGSSIAVLAEFRGASVIFGADAHVPVLIESISKLLRKRDKPRLELDLFKVPHHGSQNNLSTDLLKLIDCNSYVLSTNGDHFCHPDRESVARIIKAGGERPALHFNYRTQYNEMWADPARQEQHGYTAKYTSAPPGVGGLTIPLIRHG